MILNGDLAVLIDASWYWARYPDVHAAQVEPIQHYQATGWQEGRWPNDCFDPDFYRLQVPGLSPEYGDPLVHYYDIGEAGGMRPIAWFDPGWYRQAYALGAGRSCLAHYLRHRHSGVVQPNAALGARIFGTAPAEARGGVGEVGGALGPEVEIVRRSGLLEEKYYLFNGPDILAAGVDLAWHFTQHGWRENRRPNPYFDPLWYRRMYGHFFAEGMDPLTHYILEGEARGLRPCLYFDTVWYRAAHHLPAGASPLAHYLTHRTTQTVSPLPFFDVAFYTARYRHDIRRGRDAFAHYLATGGARDFDPAPWFDAVAYRTHKMTDAAALQTLPPEIRQIPLLHLLATTVSAEMASWRLGDDDCQERP
jgi:hypothetical protein